MMTISNSKNILLISTTIINDISKVITEHSKNSKKKINNIMLKIVSQVDDYKKYCGIYHKNYEKYLKLCQEFDLLIHSKDNLSNIMDNIDGKVGNSSSHGVVDHIHGNVDVTTTNSAILSLSASSSSEAALIKSKDDNNFMNRSLTKMLSKIAPEKKYDEKYKIFVKDILQLERTLELNSKKLTKQYEETYIDIEKCIIDCINYESNRINNIKNNCIKFNLIFDNIVEQNSIINTNLMSQIMLFDSENEAINLMNEINYLSMNTKSSNNNSNSNSSSNSSSSSESNNNNNNNVLGFINENIIDTKSVDVHELFSKTEKLSEIMESLKILLSRFITSLIEISEVEMIYAVATQKCIDKYGCFYRRNNNNNNGNGDAFAAAVDSTDLNSDTTASTTTTTIAAAIVPTDATAITNSGNKLGNMIHSDNKISVNLPITLNEQSTSTTTATVIATNTSNKSMNNNNNNKNNNNNNNNNNNYKSSGNNDNIGDDVLIDDKDAIEVIRYYNSIINCIHNFSDISSKTSELMNEDICSSLDIVKQRLDISGKQLFNKLQYHMKLVDNIKSYDIRIRTKLDKLQLFLLERKTTLKQAKEKEMLSPVDIPFPTEKEFPVSTEISAPTEAVDYLNHSYDPDRNEVMITTDSVDDGVVTTSYNVVHANTLHNDNDDINDNNVKVAKECVLKDFDIIESTPAQMASLLSTDSSLSAKAAILDNKAVDDNHFDLISLDGVNSTNTTAIHISTSSASTDSNNLINQSSSITPTTSTFIASSLSSSPITLSSSSNQSSSSISSSLQRRTSMLETKLKIVVGLEKHSDRIQRIEKQIISLENEEKELIQQCQQSSTSLYETSTLAMNEIFQLFVVTKDTLITDLNTIKNTMELLLQCRQESLLSMMKLNQISQDCHHNIIIDLCKNSFMNKIKNIFYHYTNESGIASNQSSSSSSSSSSMILELEKNRPFTLVENEFLSHERQQLILQQQVIEIACSFFKKL
jgi:hypothetical protein